MATYPVNFTTSDANIVSLIKKANATIDPNTGKAFTSTDRAVAYLMGSGPQKDALISYPPFNVDLQRRAAVAAQTNYMTSLISPPAVALGFTFSQALYNFGSIAAGGSGGGTISVDTVGTFPFPGFGGVVAFSYNAPAGITLSFSPTGGTLDSSSSHPISSTVTINIGGGVQDGVYHIGVFCTGGVPSSCKSIIKITTTGGTVTATSIRGPFSVTRHAAMTVASAYDFTYTYTPPADMITINRWSIWLTLTDMTGQGVDSPPPGSAAFDVWFWNTQQINLYETNGIGTTLLQVGTSSAFINTLWNVPMALALLGMAGGPPPFLQLFIPSIAFLVPATYEMFMSANVTTSSRGSYFEQDEAESVWFDMGPYVVT